MSEKKIKFDLRTVGRMDALDRVQYFCDVDISADLNGALGKLNNYRNDLTHYTLQLGDQELEKLVVELKATFNLALEFLNLFLPGTMKRVDRSEERRVGKECRSREWTRHNNRKD